MSPNSIPRPGSGRVSLALLAVVPAVLAYPWQSARDYWLLCVAAGTVIMLFGWWRGLYFTSILRRGLAIIGRRRRAVPESGTDTRTTTLLRVAPPDAEPDALPLPLIARYLNRYGIRADAIRITSHRIGSEAIQTWIGLTLDAADNLTALRARSPRIPLHETAQVAARRLADHLREIGWEASSAAPDDIPPLLTADSRETWRGLRHDDTDYLVAHQVGVSAELGETLTAIRSYPARETWLALEIAGATGSSVGYTLAAACAFRIDAQPGGAPPFAGLTPQRGNQRPALVALDPLSTHRLDGHVDAPADLLDRLQWLTAARAPLTEAANPT